MEAIGTQVKLPMHMAMEITLQGIRIRLGRALVTISGVTLGIAFLMSVMVGEVVKTAVSQQKEFQQTVKLMQTLVTSEVGSVEGKTISIAAFGTLSREEKSLVRSIISDNPKTILAYQLPITDSCIKSVQPADLGKDSSALLVVGSAKTAAASLSEMTKGMIQPVVLDSEAKRTYREEIPSGIRREFFFGVKSEMDKAEAARQAKQERFRTIWIVSISLLVTVIGISNALLMSVTERFKEIGTMKCLGALSSFIRKLFLVESAIIGCAGSVLGVILGAFIPMLAYSFSFGFGLVFGAMSWPLLLLYAFIGIGVGTLLSMIAAIYPANFAAKMVPAMALRSNV